MPTLYGRSTSINVRKVLWCAAELGLPLDHVESGRVAGELRTPAFLAMNPNAKVPVIDDGGFVLWESNAICRYLAAREARDDLLPVAAAERALVEQWMDWQTTDLNMAWRYAFLARVRATPPVPDPDALRDSVDAWNRHMAILDARLVANGGHVAGDRFTLADLVLGVSTYRWLRTPIERVELPAVAAWFETLAARPAFRGLRWGDSP